MRIDRQDLIELLDVEEPDYDAALGFGDEAIPHLIDIVRSEPPLLAQKATAFAARIQSDHSLDVIRVAAESKQAAVRVAAAAALGDMASPSDHAYVIAPDTPAAVDEVLGTLLLDEDDGVRRFAQQSADAMDLTRILPNADAREHADSNE